MAGSNIGSSLFFIANLLNFVLATAIFTIPFPMYEAGIFLGSLILAVTCFFSIIACTFIIEALAMKNYLVKIAGSVLDAANEAESNRGSIQPPGEENLISNSDDPLQEKVFAQPGEQQVLGIEEDDNFYIFKRYEISILGKLMIKPLYFFVVGTMICYLYVGVTSNGIIAGNNLLDIIGRTIGHYPLDPSYYYLIVCIFFFLTILIALNNIVHLKKFSMFIMVCRFLIIFLIIGCCFYSIFTYGPAKYSEVKKFDLSNVTVMIGNSLFVFMSHHSIPGMVESFSPQKNLMTILIVGYLCSLLFMLFYGYLSVFAFGKPDLTCDKDQFPNAIQSTFSSNFLSLPVIGYIINYYPVLNVITSGMQLITLRNNILEAIGGCSKNLRKKLTFTDKTDCASLFKNFLFNLCVCVPPIVIGLTMKNIQSLMKYFSSVLGFLLMMIVPALIVFNYRRYFVKRKYIRGLLNNAFVSAEWGIYLLEVVAAFVFGMIIYGFVLNVPAKTCINEIR